MALDRPGQTIHAALGIARAALVPYLNEVLSKQVSKDWLATIQATKRDAGWSEDNNLLRARGPQDLDLAACLNILKDHNWKRYFRAQLGKQGSSQVGQLMSLRRGHAHQNPFTEAQAREAIGVVRRLLRPLGRQDLLSDLDQAERIIDDDVDAQLAEVEQELANVRDERERLLLEQRKAEAEREQARQASIEAGRKKMNEFQEQIDASNRELEEARAKLEQRQATTDAREDLVHDAEQRVYELELELAKAVDQAAKLEARSGVETSWVLVRRKTGFSAIQRRAGANGYVVFFGDDNPRQQWFDGDLLDASRDAGGEPVEIEDDDLVGKLEDFAHESYGGEVPIPQPVSVCRGTTKTGNPCRRKATPGRDYCPAHAADD